MKFFSKYSYDFNNMIVEEIRCEKILKNINKTQKVDNSISKKEYYIARKSTDDIYDVFKGRKKLSKIQREFLDKCFLKSIVLNLCLSQKTI